jgi:hypothetical protein
MSMNVLTTNTLALETADEYIHGDYLRSSDADRFCVRLSGVSQALHVRIQLGQTSGQQQHV